MTIEMMLEEWLGLMVLKVEEMGGICRLPKSFFDRIPYATVKSSLYCFPFLFFSIFSLFLIS